MTNHERAPGIGMLAGWRGENGERHGAGAPNKGQLDRYIANGCFWEHKLAPEQRYFKHANRDYLDYAASVGFIGKPDQIIFQVYSEPLQKFRLAARGHGPVQPPDSLRQRIETYFDPLPIWYPPFEGTLVDTASFPLHAITQRPMAMYHSWGSQNAWLRQIHGVNPLYINRATATRHGIEDGDWVWVTSHHGRIKAPVKLMEGVNPDTVWTWNAIGKRSGAWNLDPAAPEAKTGFLLNHVISDLLPAQPDGMRYANSDPVTGQAAWYDLRVRIEKCAPGEAKIGVPDFGTLNLPPDMPERPGILRYGRIYSRAWRRVRGREAP
jgi:anaerobic selenocysteine-containing dehydrogenase